MSLLFRRTQEDWRYTGEWRWEAEKEAGGYVAWEKRGKWVDMESGEVKWEAFWAVMSLSIRSPFRKVLPAGVDPNEAER